MTTYAVPPTLDWCLVLIDQTTGDRPDLAPFLPKLAEALNEGLSLHVKFWGVRATVRVASSPTDRGPGEVAMHVRHKQDGDPDGALAWHQIVGGMPDIELPLDAMSGLTGDSDALDVCASHELFEALVDPGANQLADNGNGIVSATEDCDRIEDTFWTTTSGLHLSNFLLRAAWIPGAAGPYDYMGVLTTQLDAEQKVTMTAGGYDIEGSTPYLTDVTPNEAAPPDITSPDATKAAVTGASPAAAAKAALVTALRVRSTKPIEGLRLQRKQGRYARGRRRGVHF